jgi:hypothetical protein
MPLIRAAALQATLLDYRGRCVGMLRRIEGVAASALFRFRAGVAETE